MCVGDMIDESLGKRAIHSGEQDIAIESGGESAIVLNGRCAGVNFKFGGCRGTAGLFGHEIDLQRANIVFRGV